jgi:hypothetical protein
METKDYHIDSNEDVEIIFDGEREVLAVSSLDALS